MRGAYNYRLLLIPYLIRPYNNVAERNKIKTRSKLDSIYKPSVRFVFILNQQWPYPGYMVMKYMRFLWRYFTLVTHIHLRQIGLTIQVRYMHNSNKAKNLSNFFAILYKSCCALEQFWCAEKWNKNRTNKISMELSIQTQIRMQEVKT